MIQYHLINVLNKDKDASDIINCIQQHAFCKFKSGLKYGIIDSDKCDYSDQCDCEMLKVADKF